MSDRVFAWALFMLSLGYGYAALKLHAPFQYDPLGPETWPRLLAAALALAAIAMFRHPDPEPDWHGAAVLRRVGLSALALILYALTFEKLGFILSTSAFCVALSRYLGARWPSAIGAGVGIGVGGYELCTRLLALNLPAGLLPL